MSQPPTNTKASPVLLVENGNLEEPHRFESQGSQAALVALPASHMQGGATTVWQGPVDFCLRSA